MTATSNLGLSLDFSDVAFDDFRTYGISDLVAGDVLDIEVLDALYYHTSKPAKFIIGMGAENIPGKAVLLTGLASAYSIEDMETICVFTIVSEDGQTHEYRLSLRHAKTVFARRSQRRYNETPRVKKNP